MVALAISARREPVRRIMAVSGARKCSRASRKKLKSRGNQKSNPCMGCFRMVAQAAHVYVAPEPHGEQVAAIVKALLQDTGVIRRSCLIRAGAALTWVYRIAILLIRAASSDWRDTPVFAKTRFSAVRATVLSAMPSFEAASRGLIPFPTSDAIFASPSVRLKMSRTTDGSGGSRELPRSMIRTIAFVEVRKLPAIEPACVTGRM